MEKLSPDTAVFWPVIDLNLQVRNLLLCFRGKLTPPVLQGVNNEITCLGGIPVQVLIFLENMPENLANQRLREFSYF